MRRVTPDWSSGAYATGLEQVVVHPIGPVLPVVTLVIRCRARLKVLRMTAELVMASMPDRRSEISLPLQVVDASNEYHWSWGDFQVCGHLSDCSEMALCPVLQTLAFNATKVLNELKAGSPS